MRIKGPGWIINVYLGGRSGLLMCIKGPGWIINAY